MSKPYQPHQIFSFVRREDKTEEAVRKTAEVRENLNRDVEAFLAKGGQIDHVPGYETTERDDRFRAAQTGLSQTGVVA